MGRGIWRICWMIGWRRIDMRSTWRLDDALDDGKIDLGGVWGRAGAFEDIGYGRGCHDRTTPIMQAFRSAS
jgi:hypothetical protein